MAIFISFLIIFFIIFYLIIVISNKYLNKKIRFKSLTNSFFIFFIDCLIFIILCCFLNNFWRLQVLDFKIRNFNNTIKIHKIAEMKNARSFHKMSSFGDSKILITGGYGKKGILSSTEIFDLKTHKIVYGPKMNKPHCNHLQVTAENGNIYVIDTNGIELLEKNNQNNFKLIHNGLSKYNENNDYRIHKFSYKNINRNNILIYSKDLELLIDTSKGKVIENPKIKFVEEENNNINYQTFNLSKNKFITYFFMYTNKDYTIDSFIKIFDNMGEGNIYNTYIQPFCAISQISNNLFLVTGGEDISKNFKFNFLHKYFLLSIGSEMYRGLNSNRIPDSTKFSKIIYYITIK